MVLSQSAIRILAVIGATLAVTALGTLGTAIVLFWRRSRVEHRIDRNKEAFTERLYAEDSDWNDWVPTLSIADRRAVEAIMKEYLAAVDGPIVEDIDALAMKLGIRDRIRSDLTHGSESDRLDALSWLFLLNQPLDRSVITNGKSRSIRERELIARLIVDQEDDSWGQMGTELLCLDGDELSIFGLDTLYRLNQFDPRPVIEILNECWEQVSTAFLVQSLWVISECDPAPREVSLGWVHRCLEHETPAVRAAAISVFEKNSWREDLLQWIDWSSLQTDPNPGVRRAVYRLLSIWEGTDLSDQIGQTISREPDELVRIASFRDLMDQSGSTADRLSGGPDDGADWVTELRSIEDSM